MPPYEIIQACRESQGYFCRVLAPANIPNVLLVLAGFLGIFAAFGTLKAIQEQTEATKRSVELQEVLNQQWLILEKWTASAPIFLDGWDSSPLLKAEEATLEIGFEIVNPTKMPLTLEHMEIVLNGQSEVRIFRHVLAPDRSYPVHFKITLRDASLVQYSEGRFNLVVDGKIAYIDAFEKKRDYPVQRICACIPPETIVCKT